MFSLLQLVWVLYLAIIARAQVQLTAAESPTAISSCTLFYTPSMPPQIGPTSTVYATMMTTQLNVVNCDYCHISNVPENPMPAGPFTTKITSNYLLITQIACLPYTSALTRRHALPEATARPTALYIRGGKPPTFIALVQRNGLLLPKLVDHLKRQAPTSATDNALVLTGEPFRLIEQLFTVIYSTSVINSGVDLEETCMRLQSANAILDLAEVGLNATQAAAIVCSASLPDATIASFNQTLIASAAAGLYGVQLAANFTGTANTTRLCTELDLSLLPALGVDVDAVQDFICTASSTASVNPSVSTAVTSSGTATTASVNASVSTAVPSLGTAAPSLSVNSSVSANASVSTAVPSLGTATPSLSANSSVSANASVSAAVPSLGTATPSLSANSSVSANANVSTAVPSLGTATPSLSTNSSWGGQTWLGSITSAGSAGTAVTVPLGTGVSASGTGFYPTGNLTAIGTNAGSGTGTAVRTTAVVGSGSAAYGTGDTVASTGNTGPGLQINGTDSPFAGTGVAGSGAGFTATGVASAEYGTSTVDSSPSSVEYGEGASDRVPHGPTSTPRYYPKYY